MACWSSCPPLPVSPLCSDWSACPLCSDKSTTVTAEHQRLCVTMAFVSNQKMTPAMTNRWECCVGSGCCVGGTLRGSLLEQTVWAGLLRGVCGMAGHEKKISNEAFWGSIHVFSVLEFYSLQGVLWGFVTLHTVYMHKNLHNTQEVRSHRSTLVYFSHNSSSELRYICVHTKKPQELK